MDQVKLISTESNYFKKNNTIFLPTDPRSPSSWISLLASRFKSYRKQFFFWCRKFLIPSLITVWMTCIVDLMILWENVYYRINKNWSHCPTFDYKKQLVPASPLFLQLDCNIHKPNECLWFSASWKTFYWQLHSLAAELESPDSSYRSVSPSWFHTPVSLPV